MPAPREKIPTEHLDVAPNDLHWLAYKRNLTAAHRSKETIASYRKALADLTSFHPGRDLADLTKTDVQDYLTARLKRLAATTVAIRFRSLRAFFNWAVGEELITVSPMARMSEPKPDDVPPDIVSDANLIALLKSCAGSTFEDRRDNAIIRLFCEPGSPRVAEMAGIQIDDVDMRNDRVKVTGKGRKTRWLPFGAKTGMALDRYLRERRKRPGAAASTALWVGAKAPRVGNVQQVRKMTTSGITKMLARRASRAGIGHVHPHQLRHTSANAWHDSGGSEGDAMVLFGWSSPEMPRRYGRAAKTERAHKAARRASLGDRL
jgi:integrase/recombinase XerD